MNKEIKTEPDNLLDELETPVVSADPPGWPLDPNDNPRPGRVGSARFGFSEGSSSVDGSSSSFGFMEGGSEVSI